MGAHFAEEPQVANKFAEGAGWMKSRYELGDPKPRVIPAYLFIKNAKNFGSEYNLRDFIYQQNPSGYASDELTREAMEADGLDSEDFDNPKVEEWNNKYENDPEFRSEQNQWILEHAEQDDTLNEFAQDLARIAKSKLEEEGYDGIKYKNEVEGGTSWIAFSPEQIKSAIGNRGTFDPSSADITMNLKRAGSGKSPGIEDVKAQAEKLNPQRNFSEIEKSVLEAIPTAKSANSLASGAPGLAVRKGLITPAEAALYSRAKGFNNEYTVPERQPKPPKERIGSEDPEGRAPSVSWHEEDLQDSGPISDEQILKDYNGGKPALVYQSYIDINDMPNPVLAEEENAEDDEEPATYSREDFRFHSSRGIPPIKVAITPHGDIEILDGNHRLKYWTDQGYSSIPAWVIDKRKGKIEGLSEEEEDKLAEVKKAAAKLRPVGVK
jgi:hypothetical protein